MNALARPAPASASDVARSLIETLLTITFRRKWLILTLFATVFGGVVIATSRLPPTYKSEMKILVKNERADLVITPAAAEGDVMRGYVDENVINSEIELLTSTDLLKKVVLDRKLYPQPAGAAPTAPPDPLAVQQGVGWLRGGLSIIPVRKSNIILVTYQAAAPSDAARVLETLANGYLEAHLQLHRTPGAQEFFRVQKARYQEQLQDAEERMLTFQAKRKIYLMAEQKDLALRSLDESRIALQESEAALAEANARVKILEGQVATSSPRIVTQTRSIPHLGPVDRFTTLLPELESKRSQLLMKFLPEDRLVRQVDEEIAITRAALEREQTSRSVEEVTDVNPFFRAFEDELARARATQAGLQARRDILMSSTRQHEGVIDNLQTVTNEFEDLERLVKESKESYGLYANKEEEARIADLLDQQKISNVALAESPTESPIPSGPNHRLNLMLGFVLALFAGFGAAIALEVLTATTVYTPGEVEAGTGLTVIGVIPWARRRHEPMASMARA